MMAPPPIVATSGQLTIHFVSDNSVAYCGFEAQWTSQVAPPVPPVMIDPDTTDLQQRPVRGAFQLSDAL